MLVKVYISYVEMLLTLTSRISGYLYIRGANLYRLMPPNGHSVWEMFV